MRFFVVASFCVLACSADEDHASVRERLRVDAEAREHCMSTCGSVNLDEITEQTCASYRGRKPYPGVYDACSAGARLGATKGCRAGCEEGQSCFGFSNTAALKESRVGTCKRFASTKAFQSACNSGFTSGADAACTNSEALLANSAAQRAEEVRTARAREEADELARAEAELAAAREAARAEQAAAEEARQREAAAEREAAEVAARLAAAAARRAANLKANEEAAAAKAAHEAELTMKGKTRGMAGAGGEEGDAAARSAATAAPAG